MCLPLPCSTDSVFVPLISLNVLQMRMIAALWILWGHTTRLFVLPHMKNIYQKLYMIKKELLHDVSFLSKVDQKRMKVAHPFITHKFQSH